MKNRNNKVRLEYHIKLIFDLMNKVVFLLLCIYMVLAELSCPSGKTYVRFLMKCKNWCNEQKVTLSIGNQPVYECPVYINNVDSDTEQCIDSSPNGMYTLGLSDTQGDSWTTGSYLMIYGEYGNVFYFNYMTERRNQQLPLSIHYAIKRYEQWRVTDQFSNNWVQTSFQDSAWNEETMGSVSNTYSGTQYFRKSFTGVDDRAAYEVRMNYRFGIVAYINGAEVFRDNMPEGPVAHDTTASSSYVEVSMHGFIRPGSEVSSNTVLAVELHFLPSAPQTEVDFDAYLALLTSSLENESCVIYPYATTITSLPSSNDSPKVFDMNTNSYITTEDINNSFQLLYTVDVNAIPFVNALRYYTFSITQNIGYGTFSGSKNGDDYSLLMTVSGHFDSAKYNHFFSYWRADLFKNYKLTIFSGTDSVVKLHEVMPMVCVVKNVPTSIEYESTSYTYFANLEEAKIIPKYAEITGCSVEPSLPEGISIDSITCIISGRPTAAAGQKSYTITATSPSMTGTISLKVEECSGTVVNIVRTYKAGPTDESFTVINPENEDVIYSVASSSGQEAYKDVVHSLCISIPRIGIDISCTTSNWYPGSYLYIKSVLDRDQSETLLRARYDNVLGLSTSLFASINYPIHPGQNWFYKMGEVPSNWYSSDTSGWAEGKKGTFASSTNRVQLYKKTFSITSLNDIAGFTISVQYSYGISIYMNNVEIFRNGITEVSTTAAISNIYPSLRYHTISFPVKTMVLDSQPAVTYLNTGSNTIAIALIQNSDTTVNSTFDATLSLMGSNEYSRVFDYTISTTGAISTSLDPFSHYHGYSIYSAVCNFNSLTITFNDDRREWISSFLIQAHNSEDNKFVRKFSVLGKNQEDTDWVLLNEFTNLGWSLIGQTKKIWLKNNKPYNQYKFLNFGSGLSKTCEWKINRIDLYSDSMTEDIPNLSYSEIVAIKDVELAEVYPNSNKYRDFTISPALPTGLSLCPANGIILGTATEYSDPKNYVITAKKVNTDTETTATVNFGISPCTGTMSFITAKMRIDSYNSECSYKLFEGRGNTGKQIAYLAEAPYRDSLLYLDRCLKNGIYTFYGIDTFGDGWFLPGGYMMTVDVGSTIFETKLVSAAPKPAEMGTTFSSYLPFQVTFTEWKLMKSTMSDLTWTQLNYDDSTWTVSKASDFGSTDHVTSYIRKTFDIPNLDDYQVLNVRLLYSGGVVAYFNGKKVARFNLADQYDASTYAVSSHDFSVFSSFHVILRMSGAVVGNNVMAFEIHTPSDVAGAIQFDATGIFGVEQCSMVLDTYTNFSGTNPSSTGKELPDLFDYNLLTYSHFSSTADSKILWNVENLEGTVFNSYGLISWVAVTGIGFSLMGNNALSEQEDYINFATESSIDLSTRKIDIFMTPINFIPFRSFKWVVETSGSVSLQTSSFLFYYCKAEGDICQGDDTFPTVGEGQLSPALCDEGYNGYKYRLCSKGALGEIQTDKCVYKEPTNLFYIYSSFEFVMGTNIVIPVPSYENIITKFTSDKPLPVGLTLDEATGSISGKPTAETALVSIVITGENPVAATQTTITISVRKGHCIAEGYFPTTNVGETAVLQCSVQGSYIGTQKRYCALGARDGEWKKASGMCVPVFLTIILIAIVLLMLVVVVFFIARATRRKKAVGGVRSKKAIKKISAPTKGNEKKVKV